VNDGAGAAGGREAGERPPLGGRWGVLYAIVIAALAAEIALLAWLTEAFR
jgi:hypothetical protein